MPCTPPQVERADMRKCTRVAAAGKGGRWAAAGQLEQGDLQMLEVNKSDIRQRAAEPVLYVVIPY